MKNNKLQHTIMTLFLLFVVFNISKTLAQTTTIPDANFEQALIDMNIDSDGEINGQVLTSDIDTVTVLDFENVLADFWITDLTGIQDFVNLEVFKMNGEFGGVNINDDQADIFTNNSNLRELIIKNTCGDCISSNITSLDMSGLPDLELIDLTHVILENQTLKLNNPDFNLYNLTINLYHEGFPLVASTMNVCIEVHDPDAATNNQSPYNTWNIIVNESMTTYGFGENCTFSSITFEDLGSLSTYPNPAKDKLWIENPNQININNAEIYTVSGNKVSSFSSVKYFIYVGNLKTGVYFVKFYNEHSSSTVKLLKN